MSDIEFDPSNSTLIEGPTYRYVPTLDRNAFVRVDLVRQRNMVGGQSNRETVFRLESWADTVSGVSGSGTWEPLHSMVFGTRPALAVSG